MISLFWLKLGTFLTVIAFIIFVIGFKRALNRSHLSNDEVGWAILGMTLAVPTGVLLANWFNYFIN
jgi:NAD/NADP transhydrogenase beta subunit